MVETTSGAGDGDGRGGDLPLTGIRVLAVEQYAAGPYGTMHLADLGAEVIKIEPPRGGDMSRGVGPFVLGEGDSDFFQSFNRNKRSVTLDLKSAAGREVFHRLAATAHGLLDNLRGDQPAKLGLTRAALAASNPALVCVHISAYGRTGERAAWPGYDYLMQAEAGWLALTGEPGSPPTRMGLSLVDYMAGVTAALALVAGLVQAGRTGRGRDYEVSLYDIAMAQLTYPAAWYLNEGYVAERRPRSGHPATVPVELFPTADGWLFVMCITARFWAAMCAVLGLPGLALDPRFADFAGRRAHRADLVAILDPLFRTRPTNEWLKLFQGVVPAAPFKDLPEALDAPRFRERGGVQTVTHPVRGDLRLLSSPIRVEDDLPLPMRAAPALGADNDAVLAELGYAPAEIAALKASGAI